MWVQQIMFLLYFLDRLWVGLWIFAAAIHELVCRFVNAELSHFVSAW